MTELIENQIDVFQFLAENENQNKNEEKIDKVADTKKEISFDIGDLVEIEYEKKKNLGEISNIYNNGNTVNVIWNGKHSAFYYKNVELVKKVKKIED